MGKKNKKEKKGQGMEKTLHKTEKKANKRAKKELAEKGEDDIEKMIAEFQQQDKRKTQVLEEKCPPPSPRSSMSLSPHPDKDELIMFGGEFFTGHKMFLYNDLFFYNIKKNDWLKVTAPNSPPPRSAHQAVAVRQGGGQLWIFGGEFASPTQSQFYHYKDLWVYLLKEKRWEKVSAPGGPSARSGHRMVQCKKQLIVFGGFHDNTRDYRYFNDVYAFNLDTYTWMQVVPGGNSPAPRSGVTMATLSEQGRVVILGGYSKERVKRDVDVGKVHADMFVLIPEGKAKDDAQPTKWKWSVVKQSGAKPSPRSGLAMVVVGGNRAVCFGGVYDVDESEEKMKSQFYNDLLAVELDKGKWFELELRGKKPIEKKKRRKKKDAAEGGDGDGEDNEEDEEEENDDEDMYEDVPKMDIDEDAIKNLTLDKTSSETDVASSGAQGAPDEEPSVSAGSEVVNSNDVEMETSEESVFKVTVGPQSSSSSSAATNGATGGNVNYEEVFMPSPRMNALLAVKGGQLFLYGGMYERGDKQYTLSDFYSIDVQKLDEWRTIIQTDLKSQVWEGSDSSDTDEEDVEMASAGAASGGQSDDSDDSDDELDIDFSDAPEKPASEPVKQYFERTKDYWVSKAKEYCDSEEMTLPEKKLEKLAKDMCLEAFD